MRSCWGIVLEGLKEPVGCRRFSCLGERQRERQTPQTVDAGVLNLTVGGNVVICGMIAYSISDCERIICSEMIRRRCTCCDLRCEVLIRIHVCLSSCITVTRANQVPKRTWSCVFVVVGITRRSVTCLRIFCPAVTGSCHW